MLAKISPIHPFKSLLPISRAQLSYRCSRSLSFARGCDVISHWYLYLLTLDTSSPKLLISTSFQSQIPFRNPHPAQNYAQRPYRRLHPGPRRLPPHPLRVPKQQHRVRHSPVLLTPLIAIRSERKLDHLTRPHIPGMRLHPVRSTERCRARNSNNNSRLLRHRDPRLP
jgi:hypothetical protein